MTENTGTYSVPAPPNEIFEVEKTPVQQVLSEDNPVFILDKLEMPIEGGIYRYLEGAKYPCKGWPFPEAIASLNVIKKLFVNILKLGSNKIFIPSYLLLTVFPHKTKIKYIEQLLQPINEFGCKMADTYFLKDRFLTPLSRELGSMVYDFMLQLGINNTISIQTSKLIETMFEYDDAYRYRLEDIMSETTKEKLLLNPRKEIARLMSIYAARETDGYGQPTPGMAIKAERLARLLKVALLLPSFRKAFIHSIETSDFTRLQYDEADRYWCGMRADYKYFGLDIKDREGIELLQGYKVQI